MSAMQTVQVGGNAPYSVHIAPGLVDDGEALAAPMRSGMLWILIAVGVLLVLGVLHKTLGLFADDEGAMPPPPRMPAPPILHK